MTFLVDQACIRCESTDCVDVCPVDAFREGSNFLVIDFDECIDCAVNMSEFEVTADLKGESVPGDRQDFTPLYAGLALVRKPITKPQPVLLDACAWTPVEDKRARTSRWAGTRRPASRVLVSAHAVDRKH